jgi:hypothetical protein
MNGTRMQDIEEGLKQIAEIRSIMERSSKFLSLSGLAGVGAGIIGVLGTWAAVTIIEGDPERRLWAMLLLAAAVLGSALAASLFFTVRQAKRRGLPLWTRASRLLVFSLSIPLLAGGVLCVALLLRGVYDMLPASMLLFYGVGLFSASQFSHIELRHLGYAELVLGVVASFLPGFGLLLWGAGFGLMHIVYGLLMYFHRDRHAAVIGS